MCRMKQIINCSIATIVTIIALSVEYGDSLIITSVLAGNKKFKTVSFDSKFLKPLTFESDIPNTEFRRHRVMRPPKFDIDVNIPIKLPLEDEYPKEEYRKPVVNDFFFQSGEIKEPNYAKQPAYSASSHDQYASSSEHQPSQTASDLMRDGIKGLLPTLAKSIKFTPKIEYTSSIKESNARSDNPTAMNQNYATYRTQQEQKQFSTNYNQDPLTPVASYQQAQHQYPRKGYEEQEFVPGGFINLQLSGPSGGPKVTYEDVDKERWAMQLGQTEGAMPYPYLNYHQLQNYYGGLGTFTNGLAEHRYVEHSLLDKFKSSLNHFAGKFHLG